MVTGVESTGVLHPLKPCPTLGFTGFTPLAICSVLPVSPIGLVGRLVKGPLELRNCVIGDIPSKVRASIVIGVCRRAGWRAGRLGDLLWAYVAVYRR